MSARPSPTAGMQGRPVSKLRTVEILNVSARTVRRLFGSGELVAHKFRRLVYVDRIFPTELHLRRPRKTAPPRRRPGCHGNEFRPIGGVAYGRQGTGQLLADRLYVPKYRGRR